MVRLREKIGRLAILALAMPPMIAGYIYEGLVRDLERHANDLGVKPVDERDVEIGELRAELEEAHSGLGAEANARLAAEMEVERLKSEITELRTYIDAAVL